MIIKVGINTVMRNRICQNPNCNREFTVQYPSSKKKFCCQKCSSWNSGGYREGSGRAKTGYYKGIYCGSTYELVWVIYQLDHQIEFARFNGCVEHNGVKYYPDFLQNGNIVEIKGYESQDSVTVKTLVANHHGYSVTVLRKSDLEKEFAYVKSTYTYKNLDELYDEYMPKFTYSCSYCGTEFHKNKSVKTNKKYCSRSCSLLGNRVVSGHNQFTHHEAAGVATSPSN